MCVLCCALRVEGAVRKVPFLTVCSPSLAGCFPRTRRKDCESYHVYIRPSTEHIIDMLYPVQVCV